MDQVCQSKEDPREWLVTSEWESIDDFYDWEATEEHRDQARRCASAWTEARSYKFVVREETVGAGRANMIKRGLIIAKIKPGAEQEVAKLFEESDQSELPRLAGVQAPQPVRARRHLRPLRGDRRRLRRGGRHRSRPPAVQGDQREAGRVHHPYNPETWRSPKDAQAREFYAWDPPE